MNCNTDYRSSYGRAGGMSDGNNIKIHREQEGNTCASRKKQHSGCGRCMNNAIETGYDGNNYTSRYRSYNYECTATVVHESCVDSYPLAMAYVPMQQFDNLYDPVSGLSHGTMFRALDLPWYPTNCTKECRQ